MSFGEKQPDMIRVKRLSHVAIGVGDLVNQPEFYVNMSGLEVVDRTSQQIYLARMEAITTYCHLR
jgi:catechol-2,3-dioxygenase